MQVELETTGDLERKLLVTVPAERVDEALARAYRKLGAKADIPGYRRGKAPRKVLKKHYGERVAGEVAAELAGEALGQALVDHELVPAARPEVYPEDVEPGKPFVFKAVIVLRPTPDVADYEAIPIQRAPLETTPEEVEEHIESMRNQSGMLETVADERPVEDGDIAEIQLTLRDLERGELTRGIRVNVPDDEVSPFLVDTVRGMKRGEVARTNVTLPGDYAEEDWAGLECHAEITMMVIHKVVQPALDDAFAQQMGAETVNGLREELQKQLTEMKTEQARDHEARAIIKTIVERNSFEVPSQMVAERAQMIVDNIAAHLADGMSQNTNPTLDDLDDDKRVDVVREAEFSVRRELALEAIARHEGITVEEKEVDAYIDSLAHKSGQPIEVLHTILRQGNAKATLEAKVLEDKVIDWLLERAEIVGE